MALCLQSRLRASRIEVDTGIQSSPPHLTFLSFKIEANDAYIGPGSFWLISVVLYIAIFCKLIF